MSWVGQNTLAVYIPSIMCKYNAVPMNNSKDSSESAWNH